MEDLAVVQGFEASRQLDERVPDLILSELSCLLFVILYLVVDITTLSELHDNTKRARSLIEECFLICDDIFVAGKVKKLRSSRITYLMEARILTSFSAFCFSLSDSF